MLKSNGFFRLFMLFSAIFVLSLFSSGCSSDNSDSTVTGGGGDLGVTLSKYTNLVSAIAPPVFDGPGLFAKPTAMDSSWMYGDYPLLGKVFSEDESMSLYRNVDEIDQAVDFINMAIENGEGEVNAESEEGDQFNADVTINEITDPVEIPEECQAVLGDTAITLDYYVEFAPENSNGMIYQCGFRVTDTDEYFLIYFTVTGMSGEQWPNAVESSITYAHRNLVSDAIDVRSVFFKEYNDGYDTKAIWVYNIKTVETDDFEYIMSWYSNEFDDNDPNLPESLLGCIIGAGNKDEEFVLRYRQCVPADTSVYDSYYELDQVFGPDYTDLGQEFGAEYNDLVDLSRLFTYDDLPTELLTSPLDPADLISPWGRR